MMYVVIDMDSKGVGPMQLGTEGVLWLGDAGTLFPSYEAARAATRRSTRYARRENLPWGCRYRIMRVARAGEGKR